LGAILTLAIQGQNVPTAMFYLFIYSMGLAVPFLVTAWMLSAAPRQLKRLNRHMLLIERASGAFIILVGVLLLLNAFSYMNLIFSRWAPVWLLEYS
jgi:cytochrome c-type biogenesis protein